MAKGKGARFLGVSLPTREQLESSRLLRPIAHRVLAPELWRFTRRSVPRGVALGVVVGIMLIIPGLHMVCAALLAFSIRANVPVAIASTFLSNPATIPFFAGISLYIGNHLLGRTANISAFYALVDKHAGVPEWAHWLLSEAAPALVFGLAVTAIVTGAIGHVVAGWLWRAHMSRKWKARSQRS